MGYTTLIHRSRPVDIDRLTRGTLPADKRYAIRCAKAFAERARQHLDVRQVILFGSYANGTATEDSDIDLAVVTDTPPEDWLEASTNLFRLRRDIDPSTDRSGFLEEIRRTGEVIYDRKAA